MLVFDGAGSILAGKPVLLTGSQPGGTGLVSLIDRLRHQGVLSEWEQACILWDTLEFLSLGAKQYPPHCAEIAAAAGDQGEAW